MSVYLLGCVVQGKLTKKDSTCGRPSRTYHLPAGFVACYFQFHGLQLNST